MVDDILIQIINEERKNLKIYYFWQLLWGGIFLLLVFASSIFFGIHSKNFWIYIIIPLLVIGGFWAFVQSTKDNIQVKLNQRIIKAIVERHFSDFRFYPIYNLNKQEFEARLGLKKIFRLYSRNAILGEIEDMPVTMCYVRVDKNTDRGVITAYSGIYLWVTLDFSFPPFAIYPKRKDIDQLIQQPNLQLIKTKLDSEFMVYANEDDVIEIIDRIGPDILKYSHICSDPQNFFLTTFNNQLNIGLLNGKDFVNFSLKHPIKQDQITEQIKNLEQCLEFIHKLILHLNTTH